MTAEPDPVPSLAPLQQLMLGDSLAAGGVGHHVEQVEIVLAPGLTGGRVAAAWVATVARTAALRIAFLTTNSLPGGLESVEPGQILDETQPVPPSWESWLEVDRHRSLLAPHEVPWRAVYWHEARRFIWTFHHALLDGRSIARVLRSFLTRLDGGEAEDLAISEWRGPSPAVVAVADRIFRKMAQLPEPVPMTTSAEPDGPAVRHLGASFALHLDSLAEAMKVTAATILTWAWGQALTDASGTTAVLVEQLRAGAPQPGTAGFTMNTLPVIIHRTPDGTLAPSLLELHARLKALRGIETVSADDFPPGVFPNMDTPGSSVIMIERATLRHAVGGERVESLVLHEAKGETLMATAHLLPDLRLEVEGPERHRLLEAWIGVLEREIHLA